MNKTNPTYFALVTCFALFFTAFTLGHFIQPELFAISSSYNLHRAELLGFLCVSLFCILLVPRWRIAVYFRVSEVGYLPLWVAAALLAGVSCIVHLSTFGVCQFSTYAAIIISAIGLSLLPKGHLATVVVSVFSAYSLLSLLQIIAYSVSGTQPHRLDIAYGFANVRFLNHLQSVLIPLSIGYALSAKTNPLLKYPVLIATSASLCQLLLTGGRGTTLALLVSAAIYLFLRRGSAVKYLTALLLSGAIGVCLALLVSHGWTSAETSLSPEAVLDNMARPTGSGRLSMWSNALELIYANPLFGIGPGNYRYNLSGHAHNELLTLTVEYGLPAAALTISCIILALWKLTRLLKGNDLNHLLSGAWIGLISAFCHSLFSGIFMSATGQLATMLAVAICLAERPNTGAPIPLLANRPLTLSIQVLIGVLFLTTAKQFVTGTFDMLSPTCESKQNSPPRIWRHTDSPCFPKLVHGNDNEQT